MELKPPQLDPSYCFILALKIDQQALVHQILYTPSIPMRKVIEVEHALSQPELKIMFWNSNFLKSFCRFSSKTATIKISWTLFFFPMSVSDVVGVSKLLFSSKEQILLSYLGTIIVTAKTVPICKHLAIGINQNSAPSNKAVFPFVLSQILFAIPFSCFSLTNSALQEPCSCCAVLQFFIQTQPSLSSISSASWVPLLPLY